MFRTDRSRLRRSLVTACTQLLAAEFCFGPFVQPQVLHCKRNRELFFVLRLFGLVWWQPLVARYLGASNLVRGASGQCLDLPGILVARRCQENVNAGTRL